MWQDRDSLCHPALRPEGDAQKIGCYIGRILTPVPHPDPPLRPVPNPQVLLKDSEMCTFAEHV